VAQAQALLGPRFIEVKGTSAVVLHRVLEPGIGLDIAGIKRTALARVNFLPGAEEFLLKLKKGGKRECWSPMHIPRRWRSKTNKCAASVFRRVVFHDPFTYPKEDAEFGRGWRPRRSSGASGPCRG